MRVPQGMNVQAGVWSSEESDPGSQDYGKPCGAGDQGSDHSGAQAKLSGCMVQFGAWFQIFPS